MNDSTHTTGSSHFDGAGLDVADITRTSPEESQQFGANDSSMGFAKILLGEDDDSNSPASGAIPGDAGRSATDPQTFSSILTPLPSQTILQVAVDAYFDRVNWYIMLFHQPSFAIRTQNILRRTAWRRDELCDVLLVATVAALGLRCVEHDKTWKGHHLLEAYSVTAESLVSDLMSQIASRFYELMLESRIEVFQICMLLTIYHVYFGSSTLAWNVSGVSTRAAYALALHCDKARNTDEIAREVSNRCWNHLVVSDQFSSMIFGRPASLDPAFAQFKRLADLDDTDLPDGTAALAIFQEPGGRPVTFLTYHTLKFELYDIIRQTLQSFRVLQLQSPVSVQDLKSLIQVVNTTELMLKQWHDNLPAVFTSSRWPADDPWNVLELDQCSSSDEISLRRKIGLQGFILQLLYDAARVWAHRPLLKLRISISPKEASDNFKIARDDIPDSLGTSVRAALRMSRVPVHEFEGQLAQSFVLMHLFTAGVILCIAPTCQPYSQMAGEAKAGVLRIIAACRAIKDESKIAKHTDQMMTRLYKKTMQREMDNALRPPPPPPPDTGGIIAKDRLLIGPTFDATRQVQDSNSSVGYRQPHGGGTNMMSSKSPSFQVGMTGTASVSASASTGGRVGPLSSPPPSLDYQNHTRHAGAEDFPDHQPVVSYLQFESLCHNNQMFPNVNEHIDEAYGAFEQSKCLPHHKHQKPPSPAYSCS
ncbi:uncharacterized protein Z520_04826 [Fonsecaea multimorphosa CBS 102226]|uniref:Xylanolytic transcriptional activator regulatory domain-containing protein n=1 Tax=Fonsecaea multimorphosa CBS 102226 TaxID=1442371 RepID=A0A0D2HBH7_9EURO|nr:uncharacterized protein Z520_04826 [Fonsecaea multimorphosa CBS 102226]KIX99250.1 hypothetical protein Z520_04826 [Fonsecaea multimorphosa CBS 102226]OAL25942.1 hypothetical protein AYO22_04569 [Fonsecaea multimorphosa]